MNMPLNLGVTPDRVRLDRDQIDAILLGTGREWMGGPGVYTGP